jgi:hypothetical protein
VLDQLAEELAGIRITHDGSGGHAQDQTRTIAARPVLPLAVLPPLRAVMLLVPVIQERGEVPVGTQDHVSAPAAIATRGPASRHAFLPPERFRPGAARSAVDMDHCVIDEHLPDCSRKRWTPVLPGRPPPG